MRLYRLFEPLLVAYTFAAIFLGGCTHQVLSSEPSVVRQPSPSPADDAGVPIPPALSADALPTLPAFPPSDYFLATGRGDLNRGASICVRAADMAARAELAKLIRVQVKERSTDRVRERTSRSVEQDIEVIREEQVNELLQEVRIVQREMDKTTGICISTAAMPKRRIAISPDSSQPSTERAGPETSPPKTLPGSSN